MRLTCGAASSSNDITCRKCVNRHESNHYHYYHHRSHDRHRSRARRRRRRRPIERWSDSLGRKGAAVDESGCCLGSSAGKVVLAAVVHSHQLRVEQQVRCASLVEESSTRACEQSDKQPKERQATSSKEASNLSAKSSQQERGKASKLSRIFSRNKRKLSAANEKEQAKEATELIDKLHCNGYKNEQSTINSATTTTNNTTKQRTDSPIELSERCSDLTRTTEETNLLDANLLEQVRAGNYLQRRGEGRKADKTDRQQVSSGESCVGGNGLSGSDVSKEQVIEFKFDLIVDDDDDEDEADNASAAADADEDDEEGEAIARREIGSGAKTTTKGSPVERCTVAKCRGQNERKLADNVNELIEAFVLDSSDVCLMTAGKRRLSDSCAGSDVSASSWRSLCELLQSVDATGEKPTNKSSQTADEFDQINQLAAKSVAYAFELLRDGRRRRTRQLESADLDLASSSSSSIEIGATLFLHEPDKSMHQQEEHCKNIGSSKNAAQQFSIIDLVDGGEVCADNRNGSNVIECHSLDEALTCVQRLKNNLRHLQSDGSFASHVARETDSVGGGRVQAQEHATGRKAEQNNVSQSSDKAASKKLLVISFKLKRRINGGLFSNRMCLIDFDSNFVELRCIFESIFNGQALAHLNGRKIHLQELESELASKAALWRSSLVSNQRQLNKVHVKGSSTSSSSSSSSSSAALSTSHNSHLDLLEKQHHRVASLNKLVQAEWLLYKLLSSVLIRTLIIVHVHRLVCNVEPVEQKPSAKNIETTKAKPTTSSLDGSPAKLSRPKTSSKQRCHLNGTGKRAQSGSSELVSSTTESCNGVPSQSTSEQVHHGDFDGKSARSQSESESKSKSQWQLFDDRLELNRIQVEQRLMDINLDALEFARALQRASSSRLKRRKEHLRSHHLISPTNTGRTATGNLSAEHLINSNELVVHHSSPIRVKHKRRQVSGAIATPTRCYKVPLKGVEIAPVNPSINQSALLMRSRGAVDCNLMTTTDASRITNSNQVQSTGLDSFPAVGDIQRARHLLYSCPSGNESSISPSTVVGSSDCIQGSSRYRFRVFQHRRDVSADRLCYNASDLADSCSVSTSSGSQRDKREAAMQQVRNHYDDTSFLSSNEPNRTTASSRLFYGTTSANCGNLSDSDSIASTNLNSYSSASISLRRKRSIGGLLGTLVGASSPSQNDDLDSIASINLQRLNGSTMAGKLQVNPCGVDTLRQPIELRRLDACIRATGTASTSSSAMDNNRGRECDNWMSTRLVANNSINLNQSVELNQMIPHADTIEDSIHNKTTTTLPLETYQQADYETDSAMLDDNVSDVCSMVAEPPRQLKLEEFLSHLSSFIGPASKTVATNGLDVARHNGLSIETSSSNKDLNSDDKYLPVNSVPMSKNNEIAIGSSKSNGCEVSSFGRKSVDRKCNTNDEEDIEDEDCKSHSSILERLCSLALESSSRVRLNGSGQQTDCSREQVEQNASANANSQNSSNNYSLESSSSEPFSQAGESQDHSSPQTGGHLKRILNSSHQLQRSLCMRNNARFLRNAEGVGEESNRSTEQRLKALIIECQSAPTSQPRLAGSVASSTISSTESNCSSPLSSSATSSGVAENNKCAEIGHDGQQVHTSNVLCANLLRHQPKLRT